MPGPFTFFYIEPARQSTPQEKFENYTQIKSSIVAQHIKNLVVDGILVCRSSDITMLGKVFIQQRTKNECLDVVHMT